MPALLANLLARHGYAIVFLGVFLESAGVPCRARPCCWRRASSPPRARFALPWVIGLGIGAAILGDNVGYWIGRRAGRPLVERHGRLVGLTPGRVAAFDAFFQRHGARTVFLARFVTGLRVVAALFAGVARLPWSEFLFYKPPARSSGQRRSPWPDISSGAAGSCCTGGSAARLCSVPRWRSRWSSWRSRGVSAGRCFPPS